MKAIPCLFFLLLSLIGSTSIARGEEFCAITLNVFGSNGEPIKSTWIELDDSTGKAVLKEPMSGPTFHLCDFGFGPHTLRVGTNECLPVAISNLQAIANAPVVLNVTLNPCGYREQVRSGCLLYVRVADEEGKTIPEVDLMPRFVQSKPLKTDSYGRYQTLFRGLTYLDFSKEGFAPETVHFVCQAQEEVDKEVVMRRVAAKNQP